MSDASDVFNDTCSSSVFCNFTSTATPSGAIGAAVAAASLLIFFFSTQHTQKSDTQHEGKYAEQNCTHEPMMRNGGA